MNNKNYMRLYISLFFITLLPSILLKGQSSENALLPGDSIELSKIIKDVIQNYPSIKEAEEAINSSDAKIGFAKSGYYPEIDITANYSHIGPVSTLTFPGLGTFQLYPNNNYSSYINYKQNIWDFGVTKQNIEFENKSKQIADQSLNFVKQKLAITVINNYYAILYLQKAIQIKQQQINTLNKHLDFVKKKMETGSATEYEILSTQVKITNIESQKLDLEGLIKNQFSVLNNLLAQPSNKRYVAKDISSLEYFVSNEDSIITNAIRNRDEMKMAQIKSDLAQIHLQIVKYQNNPVLSIIVSGGFKNGYIPDENKFQSNYIAGFGFRLPIFDGTRNKYNQSLAKSSILICNLEKDIIQRNISNEVIESETNLSVAIKKVKQFEMQLNQSKRALELAEINYNAGSLTNLDLMDATTSVSESQLLLLKSKIDYILSIYKLKVSVGEKIY
ncbi:MAG: TolC family protein [Bacteroidales bacterium]|nr:TolC family protein [Bacteroidales bacterium]